MAIAYPKKIVNLNSVESSTIIGKSWEKVQKEE
jgi:hypothetical protein